MKFIALLLIALLVGCAGPEPVPTPEPTPVPTPEPTPVPTPEPTPVSDSFKEVDSYFTMTELFKSRSATHPVDSCLGDVSNFADSIDNAIDIHMKPYKNHVQKLAPYYYVPSSLEDHVETSLKSHRLCTGFTSSNLSDVLKKIPSQSVIDKMNKFSELSNSLRGDPKKFKELWKKMFGCLSYVESLTTADTPSSYSVAKKFNYDKPKGVKFYDDPYQSEASRYNIGLYQFTPDYRGNVNPCLRNWNALGNCKIELNSNQSELVKVFGSGQQVFNAFCGVNKVVGTFAIQQNSSSMTRVFKSDEGKPVGQRCVTPFIYAGWGYNHFGPLQNSTGKNLDKLLSCVLN